jgi:3-methyladenine DNA glycosylase AlkD
MLVGHDQLDAAARSDRNLHHRIMPTTARHIRKRLAALADPAYAKTMQWFFKTGKGGYGEGDRFLGIRIPRLRACVRECPDVGVPVLLQLLRSPIHDERMFALIGLVRAFRSGDEAMQRTIYSEYLRHTRWINNWDLVDVSAAPIVGAWLEGRSRAPLYKLARSRSLWERRVAIVATLQFIRRGESQETLKLAALLLDDPHDLMHKATGWMLREAGKRASRPALEGFLARHAFRMPRTMLRYALEHFPETQRRRYMKM